MAVSVNGIIATPDGKEDFLSNENWRQFVQSANEVGTIIWGRKTYEAVAAWPKEYLDDLKLVKKIVLSHREMEVLPGFQLAHSPEEIVHICEAEKISQAIVTGGATNNTEFAKRNLIDEVILTINPMLLGKGIPLFLPEEFQLNLELEKIETLSEGILKIHYIVKR